MFRDWKINRNFFISFIESKKKSQIEIIFFMKIDILMLNFMWKNKHAKKVRKTLEKRSYKDGQAL